MGAHDLQEFIEKFCPNACLNVDLGHSAWRKQINGRNAFNHIETLYLVIDAESCLHRLYGGSYTDWVCGGQWNQMYHFIKCFCMAAERSNIEFTIFFNGALEKQRITEWTKNQNKLKENIRKIINHTYKRGTPPPKVWFTPPPCITHCIRTAFIACGVQVCQSINDHHREIIAYCRGNAFHGILGQSGDYVAFDPPRYFSSQLLKLSRYSYCISTVQFQLDELSKHLSLPAHHFPLLVTLLGNHILKPEEVAAFLMGLVNPTSDDTTTETSINKLVLPEVSKIVPAVADYINKLSTPTDLDSVAKVVFKRCSKNFTDKTKRLKESVYYYQSATRNGGRFMESLKEQSTSAVNSISDSHEKEDLVEISSLNTSGSVSSGSEVSTIQENSVKEENFDIVKANDAIDALALNLENKLLLDKVETPTEKSVRPPSPIEENPIPSNSSMDKSYSEIVTPPLPKLPDKVIDVTLKRHKMSLMHPYVYQTLTQGEIKLDVSLEDDSNQSIPPLAHIFRPIRQHIYGILFSISSIMRTTNQVRPIIIKEWCGARNKTTWTPELVPPLPFDDWQVPALTSLWFGTEPVDKNRRMRAFLSCLHSDTPSMLNPHFVPHHTLVLCCLLRYLIQFPSSCVLHRHEIDAFLATSVSVLLFDPYEEKEAPHLTPRGIELASMFMRGVDMVLFANSACGEPIPAKYAAPWMYFDGRVFQHKLFLSLQEGANLVQLCDGKVDHVARVERMRQAILEGCSVPVSVTQSLPPLNMGPRPQMTHFSKVSAHQARFYSPINRSRGPTPMGSWPANKNPRYYNAGVQVRAGSSGSFSIRPPFPAHSSGRGRGTTMSSQ
uniref:constitutive coactivator of PPAR-gamma-like protein 1 n=1 Tax=Ciona intestinalis TaxID=7719 RepID=UPI0000524098|nr:constitutive coactivator of PPAR-gamma-like protein 1 [Ciona intestinalis]|eukprot:XP_002124955.1 constitutive coactivator of PPAR-gamma-like protein 1 [Ciona intestinalis]